MEKVPELRVHQLLLRVRRDYDVLLRSEQRALADRDALHRNYLRFCAFKNSAVPLDGSNNGYVLHGHREGIQYQHKASIFDC